ncbi:DUF3039 domain-containing protein, partial [Streptomyces sp. NPDC002587]
MAGEQREQHERGTIAPQAGHEQLVSHGDGDHERFAHYVQKDKIMASALDG